MLLATLRIFVGMRRSILVIGLIAWNITYLIQPGTVASTPPKTLPHISLSACVMKTEQTCASLSKVSLTASPKRSSNQAKLVTKKATVLAMCSLTDPSYYSYTRSTTEAMNRLNANADSLRSRAASSDEGYQTFETQMNSMFTNYNSEVNKLYQIYLSQNTTCQSTAKAPITFQMFP